MRRRRHDPWEEYRKDRDDITTAAAFLMTFALLGLVAWVVFFGSGWIIPAATSALPTGKTRTPSAYGATTSSVGALSFPLTSTATISTTATTPAKPAATPTPKPQASAKLRISNTGGDGVYLRRNPNDADLWVPWPDNTVLEYLGEDKDSNGRAYTKVKDPRGNVGWMPSDYLTPAA